MSTKVSIDKLRWLQNQRRMYQPAQRQVEQRAATDTPLYGPLATAGVYGLFEDPGVRPGVFSAFPRPRTIGSLFTPEPSIYTEENQQILTAISDASGDNADEICDTAPSVGEVFGALQRYQFGTWKMQSDTVAFPTSGQLRNRASVIKQVLNTPRDRNPLIPDAFYNINPLGNEQFSYQLYLLGVSLERSLERTLIQGQSSASGANREIGWITEFNGLDAQIKTGYTDLTSGAAAEAVDSLVVTFGSDIGDTISGGDGRNIVQALSDMVFRLYEKGEQRGFSGLQYAIILHPSMWRALTEEWACNYASYRCIGSAGNPVNQNATEVNAMRLDMLRNQYLLIEGAPIPVFPSDGMARDEDGSDEFTTDIFIVPIAYDGGPLISLEYFPLNNASSAEFMARRGSSVEIMNNGMYSMALGINNGFCERIELITKMRLILQTPMLAGRLDNITYTYRGENPGVYPGESFYAGGGSTQYNTN